MKNVPRKYAENLSALKALSRDVNRMIEDGTFYELPFIDRHLLVSKMKRLYNKLTGRVSALKLQHILAAASLVIVGACAKADDTPASPPTEPPPPPPNPPAFAAPVNNPFGLTDIGDFASLALVDIDNDGDFDAFIGERYGNIIYFTNIGTSTAPAFGTVVTNPFGLIDVGFYASPALVDIDNDGDLDMFIGEYYGDTLYFTNIGTSTAPAFAAAVTNPFELTGVGDRASPEFVDIDNDGDLDAFIGERYGNTIYFTNIGSVSSPTFATAVTNPFGLIDIGWYATPTFVDIDNDGDLDAFVENVSGNTIYFQNTSI